jgi:lysophospholipase L1-like esterase/Mg-chelatase subunit ChlD
VRLSLLIPAAVTVLLVAASGPAVSSPGVFTADEELPTQDGVLSVLAMGDSYTAGNGAGAYYGAAGCWRSANNYARQYARLVEAAPHNQPAIVDNVACSGAVTADMLHSKSGRPAEVDAIDHHYDLIVVTLGGNDVHFADIVKFCLVQSFRDGANCGPNLKRAEDAIADGSLQRSLEEVFTEIGKRASPTAKIVLMGYPYLESDASYRIRSGHGGSSFIAAGKRIRKIGEDGDRVQRQVVEDLNSGSTAPRFQFVPTKPTFAGHELDAQSTNKNRWLIQPWTDAGLAWREWWYHPSATGHAHEAQLLLSSLGDLRDDLPRGNKESPHLVDVALVIDATGSMGDDIASVRDNTHALVGDLAASGADWRVTVVTYKDVPPEGDPGDYAARLEVPFSNDVAKIQAAVDAIVADGGGDTPETVLSGVKLAIGQHWRAGAKKAILVLGDAPPKDPEPVSHLTSTVVAAAAVALDPAEIYPVLINADSQVRQEFDALAEATGGSVVDTVGTDDAVKALGTTLGNVSSAPVAIAGGPYAGVVGDEIAFSASSSFDPDGVVDSYAWDFDGDGATDATTDSPLTSHTYEEHYTGGMSVTVTDAQGLHSVATADVNIVARERFSEATPADKPGVEVRTGPDPVNRWWFAGGGGVVLVVVGLVVFGMRRRRRRVA